MVLVGFALGKADSRYRWENRFGGGEETRTEETAVGLGKDRNA